MAWPSEAGAIAGTVGPVTQPIQPIVQQPILTLTPWRHVVTIDLQPFASIVVATVNSNLGPAGQVFYHWFLDDSFILTSVDNVHHFHSEDATQMRIRVIDTMDPNFDPLADLPAGNPNRRTIFWYRAFDTDISYYLVEQNKAAAGWTTIGLVHHIDSVKWTYALTTGILTDLTSYQWRITPYDIAGNPGTVTTFDAEIIVRTPDAPDFLVAYDTGTDKVTWTEDS